MATLLRWGLTCGHPRRVCAPVRQSQTLDPAPGAGALSAFSDCAGSARRGPGVGPRSEGRRAGAYGRRGHVQAVLLRREQIGMSSFDGGL